MITFALTNLLGSQFEIENNCFIEDINERKNSRLLPTPYDNLNGMNLHCRSHRQTICEEIKA